MCRSPPSCWSRPGAGHRFDLAGACLGTAGLGGISYTLIEAPEVGLGAWPVLTGAVVGVAGIAALVLVERSRGMAAMLPPRLFSMPRFSALNVYTVVVYAALGGQLFFLSIQLQNVLHYSALATGMASLPVTALLLVGSSRAGALSARIGPRLPLVAGPLVAAAGLMLVRSVSAGDHYWPRLFPGIGIFGVGLTLVVAPLTAAVLAAVPDQFAGLASGVSNAAARAGGLLAVAALPLIVGLSGSAYQAPARLTPGFRSAVLCCAGLLVLGTALAALLLRPATTSRPPGRAGQRPAGYGRSAS
jgi:hypothetical protein